jgi:hypothetical protein
MQQITVATEGKVENGLLFMPGSLVWPTGRPVPVRRGDSVIGAADQFVRTPNGDIMCVINIDDISDFAVEVTGLMSEDLSADGVVRVSSGTIATIATSL